MNHTRFPKEDHLPDWARRDNEVTKGERADGIVKVYYSQLMHKWILLKGVLKFILQ